MLRLLAFLLIASAAICQSVTAKAQESYAVELIVYEDLRDGALDDEYWVIDPGSPSASGAIRLDRLSEQTGTTETHLVQELAPEQLRLTKVWEALRQSRNYRPLLHRGWQQPNWSRSNTQPIYLSYTQPSPDMQNPEVIPRMEGIVAVYLQNYLNLSIDAIYRRPFRLSETTTALGTSPKHSRLQTMRRIRFDQLHYIDHPLFGVLLQITEFQS